MRHLNILAVALLLALLASCGGTNERLEKMIPADATGVVSVDLPSIIKKGGLADGGAISYGPLLTAALDANDASPLAIALTDLPVLGVDTDARAFAFTTDGAFAHVLLVPLADEAAARRALSSRMGVDFAQVGGLECIARRDRFVAIDNGVLLMARVAHAAEADKLAQRARALMAGNARSALDVPEFKACLTGDGDVNARLSLKALKALLGSSSTYRDVVQRVPLLTLFTDSDIDAVNLTLTINEAGGTADVTTTFDAAEGSDYLTLMKAITAKPDAEFLKVIPPSMDYVVAMSVSGDQLAALPPVGQMLESFAKLPYLGRLDVKGILASVDGSVSLALAPDPYLPGDWNAVLAVRSTRPDDVLRTISTFAQSMGQAPEVYDGEYVYQYENKMIRVGVAGQLLYVKMLNYEQTAGAGDSYADVSELFATAPVALLANKGGRFAFGLTDHVHGSGQFTPAGPGNVVDHLLAALVAIRPAAPYDEATDPDNDDFLPDGVVLHDVR